jgi:hypothetical protein
MNLRYGKNPKQNINIIIELPLSAVDGGRGGAQGAWNGRVLGIGGSGCSGYLLEPLYPGLDTYLNEGYVLSGNDLGHGTGDGCELGVNADGTYNMQFIDDLIRTGIKQQVLWSKAIAGTVAASVEIGLRRSPAI